MIFLVCGGWVSGRDNNFLIGNANGEECGSQIASPRRAREIACWLAFKQKNRLNFLWIRKNNVEDNRNISKENKRVDRYS